MLRIGNRLFLALALLMFQPVSYAQLRELGSGAPGPVKAQHLTAELISDSGAVAPGSASRVALLLTLEPGWKACLSRLHCGMVSFLPGQREGCVA
jgi:DsbC/DsbD-like thiol-disulfide interchange protein